MHVLLHMHSNPDACMNTNYCYDMMQKMLCAIRMYLVGDCNSSA